MGLSLRAGLVFREPKDGGPIRITYVVNVNPNGWIPTRLVNFVCNSQAMNVSRVRNKLAETVKVRESEGGGEVALFVSRNACGCGVTCGQPSVAVQSGVSGCFGAPMPPPRLDVFA